MYISPVRYGFMAMMNVQFPIEGYPYTQKILVDYGFEDSTFAGCLGMLFLLFIFFRVMVVVILALQDRKRGGSSNDTRNTNI